MMNDNEKRKQRNKDIIERMKKGDPLSSFNPSSSFFPPRPIITKNKKDIERVYRIGKRDEEDLN